MTDAEKRVKSDSDVTEHVINLSPKIGHNPLTMDILEAAVRQLADEHTSGEPAEVYKEKEFLLDPAVVKQAAQFMKAHSLSVEDLPKLAILAMAQYQEWFYGDIQKQLAQVLEKRSEA